MAIYYVKNGGNDSLDGLSDGNAWETLAKVSGVTFNAGDTIKFNKGDTWREQLLVDGSGTSSDYITFESYGTGDNPIINGSDIATLPV